MKRTNDELVNLVNRLLKPNSRVSADTNQRIVWALHSAYDDGRRDGVATIQDGIKELLEIE